MIEFADEVINLIKNALRKAGKKLDFKFGAFLCEISCQSSAGNRWPRLRYKLMEISEKPKTITIKKSAECPFPQNEIRPQPVNMSEGRRLTRASGSNSGAPFRILEVNDPDPVQAPVITSSSMASVPNPRRQRFTRIERDNRRRGPRQVILGNIAKSNLRPRANQIQDADSSTSSSDSVVFSGIVQGAETSTPNPAPQAGPSGMSSQSNITQSTTENIVIDLSSDDPNAADQSNQSTDYHTAPETPGRGAAAGEEDVDEDDDNDSVPDLEAIEMEIAREAGADAAGDGAAHGASVASLAGVGMGVGAAAGMKVTSAAAAIGVSGAVSAVGAVGAVGAIGAAAGAAEDGALEIPEGMPPLEDVETITIGTSTDGDGDDTDDTKYLASVSPNKIPPNARPALPLVVENDVITLEDSSEIESESEGWIDRSPSSTSTDDDRNAEISRQELRDIEQRIYDAGETPATSNDENENEQTSDDGENVPGPNGQVCPGMSRPDRDRRVNFLLLETTVVIDDGIIEGEHFKANRIAYHQRILAKELLFTLLTRMVHLDNELFAVFSDPKKHWPLKVNKNGPNSYGIAGDENWPRGLTLSEQLVAYENGYEWVCKQSDAEDLIEVYGFYHPSVFHTTGVRRVFVGEGYNRTPPPGTPMDTFNMFRDLQPIPARSSPAIVIPISPVYVPETPEPRPHFLADKKPPPEANTIPIDASVHFEHNCGLLNLDLEVNNAAGAEWAHGVLDAEDALRLPAHILPHNPFENAREPSKQNYRRSIRGVFVRLILREDSINEAKIARGIPTDGNVKRRAHLVEILNHYDEVVQEIKQISDQLEAAKHDKTAEAATLVLEGLDLNQEAISAEAARVKVENNKLRPQVRHYFTRCGDGEIVVNYEYIGYHDAHFTESELRDFGKLTRNGACTASSCQCPGNPSSNFNEQSNVTERLANFSGRTMSQFIPSREPTMPNGFRPLRQLRPTPGRPRQPEPDVAIVRQPTPMPMPEMPVLLEPEVPEQRVPMNTAVNNSATFVVQAAGMSDSDDNSEVFGIERYIPDVPAPISRRRPRPNEEFWDNCNIDSE